MKYDVVDLSAKKVGSIDLNDTVFGAEVRKDILARVIQWQLDKRRAGTHKTKDKGEVSGSSIKPFRQKGTGRARQGEKRAPQMYHGGVVFGPVVRSHEYGLTKKLRAKAMKVALSTKVAEKKLFVLDDMTAKKISTKAFEKTFKANKWDSILFVGGETLDEKFALSARNIKNVDVLPVQGANVYDMMRRDILVLSKEAVEKLEGRLA